MDDTKRISELERERERLLADNELLRSAALGVYFNAMKTWSEEQEKPKFYRVPDKDIEQLHDALQSHAGHLRKLKGRK